MKLTINDREVFSVEKFPDRKRYSLTIPFQGEHGKGHAVVAYFVSEGAKDEFLKRIVDFVDEIDAGARRKRAEYQEKC